MLQNGRERKEIIPNHVSFVYKALNAAIQRGLKLGWIAQALRAGSRPERKRRGFVKTWRSTKGLVDMYGSKFYCCVFYPV